LACLLLAILHAGGLDAQPIRNTPLTAGAPPSPGAQQPQLVMPVGETGLIQSAAFSPDGKRMIVTSNRDVKLWETATGMQLMEMADTDQAWINPAISPDGKYILVPRVGAIDVWDAADGNRVDSINDSLRLLASACFSPDGRLILAGWQNGKLSIYQTQTGQLLRSWQVVPAPSMKDQYVWTTPVLYTALFSPDGKKICYTGGGAVHIIDATTGSARAQLETPAYASLPYAHFEFSPGGNKVIGFQGADTTGKVWNAADGRLLFSFGDPHDPTRAAHLNQNETKLLTLSDSGILRILAMPDGHLLMHTQQEVSKIISAEFSSDDKTIITALENGTVIIRDALTGIPTRILPTQYDAVYVSVFNRAQQLLATISDNLTLRIWDLRSGKTMSELKGHAPMLIQAIFTRDRKTIHALTDRGDYRWDPATGRLIGRDSISGKATVRCWDSAGERLVTAMPDNRATVWNVRTGKALTTLRGHTGAVLSASFSVDGTRVVTSSADGTARIWDPVSGACLITLKGDTGNVNDAAFSPDGRLVATAAEDFTVKVWSAVTGDLLLDLRKHVYDVTTVEFSPDGSTLLSSAYDGTAKLWDVKTGSLLQDFGTSEQRVTSAWFSPDGSVLACTGQTIADARPAQIDQLSRPGYPVRGFQRRWQKDPDRRF
jgi:WD40 repeat protein